MITTAWELGGLDQYDGLNLRRWAHMLGFRGHFLTKSPALLDDLHSAPRRCGGPGGCAPTSPQLDRDTDGDNEIPPDLDTVTVINDWWPVRYGHRDDGERELAAAIAERHLAARQVRTAHPQRTPS